MEENLKVVVNVMLGGDSFYDGISGNIGYVLNMCDEIVECVLSFKIQIPMYVVIKLSHEGFNVFVVFKGIHSITKRVIGRPTFGFAAYDALFSL